MPGWEECAIRVSSESTTNKTVARRFSLPFFGSAAHTLTPTRQDNFPFFRNETATTSNYANVLSLSPLTAYPVCFQSSFLRRKRSEPPLSTLHQMHLGGRCFFFYRTIIEGVPPSQATPNRGVTQLTPPNSNLPVSLYRVYSRYKYFYISPTPLYSNTFFLFLILR